MPFEVYTDHYALQWLKTMKTGSTLLHCWSASLGEYDFTVKHFPGRSQTLVDGLSHLPVDPLLQKMPSSKYDSWRTKRKPEDSLESSMPPPTSVGRRYGSSSATGIHTKLAAASASKPLRIVPKVNWAATMDIARR